MLQCLVMSLLKYFQHKDVPDPERPLSLSISLRAISLANREVQQDLKRNINLKKRGPYLK